MVKRMESNDIYYESLLKKEISFAFKYDINCNNEIWTPIIEQSVVKSDNGGFPVKPQLLLAQAQTKEYDREKEEASEILDLLYGVNYWEDENKVWREKVSPEYPTRDELKHLRQVVNMRFLLSNVRSKGVGFTRHGIYQQLFDEIIRQVTIECGERGLLLNRVQNEMNQSMIVFEKLFTTNLQSFEQNSEMNLYLNALEIDKSKKEEELEEIENKAILLTRTIREVERNYSAQRKFLHKKQLKELSLLRGANIQLVQLYTEVTKYDKYHKIKEKARPFKSYRSITTLLELDAEVSKALEEVTSIKNDDDDDEVKTLL